MPDSEVLTAPPVPSLRRLPPPFLCSWERTGVRSARVSVSGELDVATATEFASAISAAQREARLVVIDLGALSFIALAGVRAIHGASVRAARSGDRLAVTRGARSVSAVFQLTEAADEIDYLDTV